VPKRVFVAYCGHYTFDCTVDGASIPEMFADQVRHIRFESPTRMMVIPQSRLFGLDAGPAMAWERVSWGQQTRARR
jgi:hypothetical protein